MGFSRQEYWGLASNHVLLQGIFPNPGIELQSPALQADSLPSERSGKPLEAYKTVSCPHPVDNLA